MGVGCVVVCMILKPFHVVVLTCSNQPFLQSVGFDISLVRFLERIEAWIH